MRVRWLLLLLFLPVASGALATNDPEVVILRLNEGAYEGKDLARHAHSYQALKNARHQAELGHVNSQFNVAVMYHLRGNYAHAMHWYQRAAKRKHAAAAYNLGAMHYRGEGTEVNYRTAASWIRKAAKLGMPEAQFHLGNLYYRGRGVPKDPAEEAHWYLKAAEAGLPEAQYNVAVLYANGDGVPRDEALAREWLQRARDNGFDVTRSSPAVAEAGVSVGLDAHND